MNIDFLAYDLHKAILDSYYDNTEVQMLWLNPEYADKLEHLYEVFDILYVSMARHMVERNKKFSKLSYKE